jgi:transglutaminase-like putative cysteine protease
MKPFLKPIIFFSGWYPKKNQLWYTICAIYPKHGGVHMKKMLITMICISAVLFVSGCQQRKSALEAVRYDNDSDKEHYDFIWDSPDEPYMQQLVKEYSLDKLVADCKSDLDRVAAVTHWVHGLWEHDGSNVPEKSDPLSILREAKSGKKFRCVEYSIVINGCLNALGIPSRVVGLKTKDVETRKIGAGHVAVEAYLQDLGKWVFADSQWDAVPIIDETPLNGVEFQNALASNRSSLEILSLSKVDKNSYFNWVGEYLYYFDIPLDSRVADSQSQKKLMLVPVGAKNPKVFQIKYPIGDVIYTSSVKTFYEKPKQ